MTNTINNVPREPSDIGNELHNLACHVVHNNEALAIKLGELASELWSLPVRKNVASMRALVGRELDMHLQTKEIQDFVGAAVNLLSAPSPAGVDGLEVVGWRTKEGSYTEDGPSAEMRNARGIGPYLATCYVSDAQAIIGGLRGEVEELGDRLFNRAAEGLDMLGEIARLETQRDQQAQRIGELDGLLGRAQEQLPAGTSLYTDIDAALSAGKEVE